MAALTNAFASGKGFGDSKREKREAAELAEVKAIADAPACFNARDCLLMALLARAKETACANVRSVDDAPISLRDAVVRSSKIARLCSDEPMGFPFSFALVAPKDLWPNEEVAVVCLGMDAKHVLRGAIGYWPAGTSLKAQLKAADAIRIVLLADVATASTAEASAADATAATPASRHAAVKLGHPTIFGVGENNKMPTLGTQEFNGPPALHLAEAFRQYFISRAQVNARLQRGGAVEAEKAHVKSLYSKAHDWLVACAACLDSKAASAEGEEGFDGEELTSIETAVQGMRKDYLAREWAPRCVTCSMRHGPQDPSVQKNGGCDFWVDFANEAKEAAAAAAAAAVEVGKAHVDPAPGPVAAPAAEAAAGSPSQGGRVVRVEHKVDSSPVGSYRAHKLSMQAAEQASSKPKEPRAVDVTDL